MKKTNKYSPEVRERAVRLVQESRGQHPSLWSAVESIAAKIGCSSHTLLDWVKQNEVDNGGRDGLTSDEREEFKRLQREVKVKSAEKSGCQRFVELRNGGKDESDTKSAV